MGRIAPARSLDRRLGHSAIAFAALLQRLYLDYRAIRGTVHDFCSNPKNETKSVAWLRSFRSHEARPDRGNSPCSPGSTGALGSFGHNPLLDRWLRLEAAASPKSKTY